MKIKTNLFVFVLMFAFVVFAYAGFNYQDYFNNSKYQSEFNASSSNKLIGSASDVCAANIVNNNLPSELRDIETVFLLDPVKKRIAWNVFKISRGVFNVITGITATFKFYGGIFTEPDSITCDTDYVYVTDQYANRIYRFRITNGDNGVNLTLDSTIDGTINGKNLKTPKQISMGSDSYLYVVDLGNNRILKLDRSGSFAGEISWATDASDILKYPGGVTRSDNGYVYVSDTFNNRIIRYDSSLNYINQVISSPSYAYYGKLSTDNIGYVYCTDVLNKKIYIFDQSLNLTGGGVVSGTPAFGNFVKPESIYFQKNKGMSAVCDLDKILYFGLGISIDNFSVDSDVVWENSINDLSFPANIVIKYQLSAPGGTVTLLDSESNIIEKTFFNGYQAPTTGENYYTFNWDARCQDNTLLPVDTNFITIKAVDSLGYTCYKYKQIFIRPDTTGPTLNPVTFDADTSKVIAGITNATSQTLVTFHGGVDLDNTGASGCGMFKYQYRVVKNGIPGVWIDVPLLSAKFFLSEADSEGDLDGVIDIQYRAQDNLQNFGPALTFGNIKIGWQAVPHMWADWAYKVSDTEIWLSGNSKDKYPVDCGSGCAPYNRLYPYKYYSDLMMYNGRDFSFVALTNTAVVEQQDTNGTSSPNEVVSNRRFAFDLNFDRYFLYSGWNKRSDLVAYPGSLGTKSINESQLSSNQQNSDVILNYYKSTYPNYNALITDTQGKITALNGTNSPVVLRGADGLPDGAPTTRIKFFNGYYYATRSGGRILRNAVNSGTPDLFTWTNVGPSRDIAAAETINDVFFLVDGTGWAVATGGAIFNYNGTVWTRYALLPTTEDLSCIYLRDAERGWIGGNNGTILIWDANQEKWVYSNIGMNVKIKFITATKDTVLAGGALFKSLTTYDDNIENGVLIKNYDSSYKPVKRPIGVEAISDPGKITINWMMAQPNADYIIKGYNIYRAEYITASQIPHAAFVKVNSAPVMGTTYTENGGLLDQNKNYIYAVSALYGTASEVVGEMYYSNEGFGTPKGSVWKTVGTDTYPLWDFPLGDPDAKPFIQYYSTANPKKIHGNSYGGNLWLMKYNSADNIWQDAGIQHPYSLDLNIDDNANIVDYDIGSNGTVIAAVKINNGYQQFANTWEYNSSQKWHLVNNSFNGCLHAVAYASVFGGEENIWIGGLNSDNGSTSAISKYLGNGLWEKHINPMNLYVVDVPFLRIRDSNLLWEQGGTNNVDIDIFDSGVFSSIPYDSNYFGGHYGLGTPSGYHYHQYYFTQFRDFNSHQGNYEYVYKTQMTAKVYDSSVFRKDDAALDAFADMLMLSKWDGVKWNTEYISSKKYDESSPQQRNYFINMTRIGFKIDNDISGITGIVRSGDSTNVFDDAHILIKNGHSWCRSELPGLFDLYSLDEGQSAVNDKTWIAGEYGQILEKRATVVPVPTPGNLTLNPGTNMDDKIYVAASWNPVTASITNPAINGYNLYRRHDSEPYQYIGTTDFLTTTFGDDRFMTINGTYSYKITAFDRYGNESEDSTPSDVYIGFLYTITFTMTPTFTVTPTITETSTDTFTITFTPTPTSTITCTVTPTSTVSLTQTFTASFTSTLTSTISKTITPTISVTFTPSVTRTITSTVTPTVTRTSTISPTWSRSTTFTVSPTRTRTQTITPTWTISKTFTVSPTWSKTPTVTPTGTISPTATITLTFTITSTSSITVTVSPTKTITPTSTPTYTISATFTVTPTGTMTFTRTPTATRTNTFTVSPTRTRTGTITPTPSRSTTFTVSPTRTRTGTITPTATRTNTPTVSPTFTRTASITPTATKSVTPTITPTYTITGTNSASFTATGTATLTSTPTITSSQTPTGTFTGTITATPSVTFTPTATSCVNPDLSFGNGGYAHHDNAGGGNYVDDEGRSLVIGNDNTIYVTGISMSHSYMSPRKMVLWAGDNAGNISVPYVNPDASEGVDMAKDNAGNIWVAGNLINSTYDLGLWKYEPGVGTSLILNMDDVISDHANNSDTVMGMCRYMAADGHEKILITGYSQIQATSSSTMYVLRYDLVTQSLDSGFGLGGVAKANTDYSSWANCISVDSSGYIYVVGKTYSGSDYLTLWKFNSAGTMEPGWPKMISQGGDGNAIAIGGNSIYVACTQSYYPDYNIALYKFDQNGNQSWASPKIYGSTNYKGANGVMIDVCGKIVVTGYERDISTDIGYMIMLRYNTDGSPDTDFGNGSNAARYSTGTSGMASVCKSAIYDNYNTSGANYGRIVTTGGFYIFGVTNDYDMALWRHTNDCGMCTPTYTPRMTSTPTNTPTCTPVLDAYEPDNDYYSAKVITSGVQQTHSIIPAGDVDWVKFDLSYRSDVIIQTSGFGTDDDTVIWLYRYNNGILTAVAMDDDGGQDYFSRISTTLDAGTYYVKVYSYDPDETIETYYLGLLASVLPTPTCTPTMGTNCVSLDSSFGAGGYAHDNNAGGADFVNDMGRSVVVGNDNNIYVAGSSSTVGQWPSTKMVLWKTDNAGAVTVPYTYENARGIDITKDLSGNIWIAGIIWPSYNFSNLALWKYIPGSGAVLVLNMSVSVYGHDFTNGICSYVSPSDGHEKILIAGYNSSGIYVLRFDTVTMAVDTAFGTNGVAEITSSGSPTPGGIVVDSAGNIYVAGYMFTDTDTLFDDIELWKFSETGILQPGWPKNISNPGYDYGNAIAVDKNNNIYVNGSMDNGITTDMVIYKFDQAGNQSWISPKKISNGQYVSGSGIMIDTCGKIVATGYYRDASSLPIMILARYFADGTPDLSFGDGSNTVSYTTTDGSIDSCKSAVYNNYPGSGANYGKIVTTGSLSVFGVTNNNDMTVWRHNENCGSCTPVPTP